MTRKHWLHQILRRIGEVSVEKMASKWGEGEDISDLLVKHQVCSLIPYLESVLSVYITTSKHTLCVGSFEKDTTKNEGIDGCH